VGLGDLPHRHDSGRLAAAVRDADAEALLARLPDGLETELRRQFGGVKLSEAQWKKIARARANISPRRVLLLLDEPTASLAAPSGHAVFERHMRRAREAGPHTGPHHRAALRAGQLRRGTGGGRAAR